MMATATEVYHELVDQLSSLNGRVPADGPLAPELVEELHALRRRCQTWDGAGNRQHDQRQTLQGLLARLRSKVRRDCRCLECGTRFSFADGTEDWEPGQPVDYVTPRCPECFGSDVEPSDL